MIQFETRTNPLTKPQNVDEIFPGTPNYDPAIAPEIKDIAYPKLPNPERRNRVVSLYNRTKDIFSLFLTRKDPFTDLETDLVYLYRIAYHALIKRGIYNNWHFQTADIARTFSIGLKYTVEQSYLACMIETPLFADPIRRSYQDFQNQCYELHLAAIILPKTYRAFMVMAIDSVHHTLVHPNDPLSIVPQINCRSRYEPRFKV